MVFAPLNATHYFEEARIFLRGTNGVAFRQNVLCSKPGMISCLRLKCKKYWNKVTFIVNRQTCYPLNHTITARGFRENLTNVGLL